MECINRDFGLDGDSKETAKGVVALGSLLQWQEVQLSLLSACTAEKEKARDEICEFDMSLR